jgi:hypothetical protein
METAVDVAGTPAANEAVISSTNANDTPAVVEAPSLDNDLQGIWDKHHPARENDSGRFMTRTKVEQPPENGTVEAKTEVTADQAAETVVEQPKAAIDAPISWSAEQKAKWASLPPDVQTYIAQRDKESHEAITRAGQQIKAFEPIRNVIEQFTPTFQRNGLQPHEGIARMMAVEQMLESNPRAAIAEIAKAYGVDLSGQTQQTASSESAENAELKARLAKVESHLTAQQRERINSEQAVLAREIADFAKDEKHPHFETVRNVMAGLMHSGAAETMQDAYDQAVFANPTIRQSILADQQKASEDKRKTDEAERVKNAKKAAGVNVKSSPGSAPAGKTLDDDLRAIANRVYGTS